MEKKWMSSSVGIRPQLRRLPSNASFDFAFQSRRGWILAILNATPDSFYKHSRVPPRRSPLPATLARVQRMIQDGADALDVGAESTRPGSTEIAASVELQRLMPLVRAIRRRFPQLPLSIDTRKASVAQACLAAGAQLINDVSALRHDPAMAETIASARVPVILMHMQGTPQTMQKRPRYRDVVDEVKAFFEERLRYSVLQGIRESRIMLDPGIGFGKTVRHNLILLSRLSELMSLGRPLVVGTSRKSLIGKILGSEKNPRPLEERLEGSLASALWTLTQGATGLRVHDVPETSRALRMWNAIVFAGGRG